MTTPLPGDDSRESDRLRSVALALNIPLGVFGAHRFYVGKIGSGILQLFTLGGLGLWWLYDLILIATGEFRDDDGRRLSSWTRDELDESRARQDARQSVPSHVMDELDSMQGELHELAERVDFLERLLAQQREKQALRPGEAERL